MDKSSPWQSLRWLSRLSGETMLSELTAMSVHALAHVRFRKGQTLFEMGQAHPYVYWMRSGVAKLVYRHRDGEEWIHDFVFDGMLFGSPSALMPAGVSGHACETLTACEVERIDYRRIEEMAKQSLAWQRALLAAWQQCAMRRDERGIELLTLSPAERYVAFVERHPDWAHRVTQKDLARFLGITAVSLSRIRARSQGGTHP